MAEAPHDVVVSQDGTQLFALANQQLYRIEMGKALLLKNNQGQCLGFSTSHLEMDSNGTLFLATSWEYENKYQGARIYKAKPDLSEVTPIVDYNPKYIPRPQGTPPAGESSAYIADLTISEQNKGFLLWNESEWGSLNNTYKVAPFSETGLTEEAATLARNLRRTTQITFDDQSNKLYFIGYAETESNPEKKILLYTPSLLDIWKLRQGNDPVDPWDFQMNPKTEKIIFNESGRIMSVNPHNFETVLIAGNSQQWGFQDGKSTEARFSNINAIDVDAAGNIYVADTGNRAIRKITPDGTVSTLYQAPEPAKPQE